MRKVVGIVTASVVLAGTALPAAAQRRDGVQRAVELERQGRYRDAAERFQRALEADPADLQALFGFERALRQLGRLDRILPFVDSALVRAADQQPVRALQLRVLAALGRAEALNAAAEAWIALAPGSADPYREWAFAVAQRGDVQAARRILQRGSEQLGGSGLLPELAQVDVVSGDWPAAARHWAAAARAQDVMVAAAGLSLAQAPPSGRPAVLDVLLRELGDPVARLVAADVLAGWDRPGEAWALLDEVLPIDPQAAASTLQRFADRVRRTASPEAARVRGYALERLAALLTGTRAQEARIDAARAFADAGDRRAAERMLGEIAGDTASAPAATAGAMATLIAVTAEAGRVADAERRLNEWIGRLAGDDVSVLRGRIAWAWIGRGQLDRAARVLADDSTVAALAVRGWVALFRGDLAGAAGWFREAGPYAEERARTTRRTFMLALIQRVGPDSVPALGAALLTLERGDTSAAIDALVRVARALPRAEGRGDVLGLAGRLAAARRDGLAEPLLREALDADSAGPVAPAAALALAQLAARNGQVRTAISRLEGLILAYPESAVVPEARRLLDQLRGAIPRS